MAVIAHVVLRGIDPASYEKVRAECGWLDDHPQGVNGRASVHVEPDRWRLTV